MQKKLKSLFNKKLGLDEKSIDFLTSALERNNQPGFDYIEFKQSLGALEALNMDESTMFKSAFATATTVGLTKEKLLKTAQQYKQVLVNEKAQFDAATEKQVVQRVKAKQEEVEKLRAQIKEYEEKIKQLQEKIERSNAVIAKADEDIAQAKQRILQTKKNFEHTWQSIIDEIDRDIENVEKYL
jgi:chromosome segregation ATPase